MCVYYLIASAPTLRSRIFLFFLIKSYRIIIFRSNLLSVLSRAIARIHLTAVYVLIIIHQHNALTVQINWACWKQGYLHVSTSARYNYACCIICTVKNQRFESKVFRAIRSSQTFLKTKFINPPNLKRSLRSFLTTLLLLIMYKISSNLRHGLTAICCYSLHLIYYRLSSCIAIPDCITEFVNSTFTSSRRLQLKYFGSHALLLYDHTDRNNCDTFFYFE